jgi:hypothetical protein
VQELQAGLLLLRGNALRIRSHYIKCTATPEDIRDWAREAAKMHKEIRKHKGLAKILDGKLQGDDDCATQQRIDEGLLGKKKTSRSLVDEKFAAWIYNTIMQSFDVAMSMEDCTQPMKVVVLASVYCLKVEWECGALPQVHRAPRPQVPAADPVSCPSGSALVSADVPTRYCAAVCM